MSCAMGEAGRSRARCKRIAAHLARSSAAALRFARCGAGEARISAGAAGLGLGRAGGQLFDGKSSVGGSPNQLIKEPPLGVWVVTQTMTAG